MTGEQERLRAVLQTEWDPIGVAGVPEASDEYDRYLPAIIGLFGSRCIGAGACRSPALD